MTNNIEEAVQAFHIMWDGFPGYARLINNKHQIIASNALAQQAGFEEGKICASVNDPKSHRGCKMAKMFQEGRAQTDIMISGKIRGWIPVRDYPDLTVHFTLKIPENT